MSYRKLKLNDEIYQYSIGTTGVKIKKPNGKSEFVQKDKISMDPECRQIVTPGTIRDYLLYGEVKTPNYYLSSCKCNAPKSVGALPFDAEIYGKLHYVYFCEDCFDNNAGDI